MQYTKEQVLEAVRQSKGLVVIAARQLGCTPQTVYNWIKRSPDVREAVQNEREYVLDTAELQLMKAIQNGEAWAINFALKTIGKHRGYIERSEHLNLNVPPDLLKQFLEAVERMGWNAGDVLEDFVRQANATEHQRVQSEVDSGA